MTSESNWPLSYPRLCCGVSAFIVPLLLLSLFELNRIVTKRRNENFAVYLSRPLVRGLRAVLQHRPVTATVQSACPGRCGDACPFACVSAIQGSIKDPLAAAYSTRILGYLVSVGLTIYLLVVCQCAVHCNVCFSGNEWSDPTYFFLAASKRSNVASGERQLHSVARRRGRGVSVGWRAGLCALWMRAQCEQRSVVGVTTEVTLLSGQVYLQVAGVAS